jgi:YHS domain-containing protein
MQLSTFQSDERTITAGYVCPCGCTPSVTYQRDGDIATSHCCCGNDFAVGPGADRALTARDGFVLETEPRTSGWGDPVVAAWLVGPSVHPEPTGMSGGHDDEHHQGDPEDPAVDPVCGMHVERATAIGKGLHLEHAGTDYYFCGKGCYLDFGEDPDRFLDPAYVPSM